MKRIVVIALALGLALALIACGSKTSAPAETEAPAVNMVNPWSDVQSAAEAGDGAGVGFFEVPANGTELKAGRVEFSDYHCMRGIAQANGSIGAADLLIRKGFRQDVAELSGDYTEYRYEWTQDVGGCEVSCAGQEQGKTMKALWCTDNFSYCILVRGQGDAYGLEAEDIAALVYAIQ